MKKMIILFSITLITLSTLYFFSRPKEEIRKPKNIDNMSIEEIKEYANDNNLKLKIEKEFSEIAKNQIISRNLENEEILIKISKGLDNETLKINELGNVPIMMYHGIVNIEKDIGNVDTDGYHRTSNAFRKDLEFYYQNGYRMIRLEDYINGIIKTKAGYSPIILTFDDGLQNNINVIGLDENNDLIIDPNSAVGILEEFKNKYKDFEVTATFFLNESLFNQPEYNDKILNWLINHGYDIGNHTMTHANFSNINKETTINEINGIFNIFDNIIPNNYVKILALPFGSPYTKDNDNFKEILNHVDSTLRVGWESEYSPFNLDFDKTFLKRIRAYDNNGIEFDIEMNFKLLENNRFISDGNEKTITIKKEDQEKINKLNLEIILY